MCNYFLPNEMVSTRQGESALHIDSSVTVLESLKGGFNSSQVKQGN